MSVDIARAIRLNAADWAEAISNAPPELHDHLTHLMASGWSLVQIAADGFAARHNRLRVICSWAKETDGKRWWHVSVTRSDGMLPSYGDMCFVKEHFIGADRKALHIFASKDKHVNIHATCLHLWHCVDGDPLPEFSGVIGGKRTI
jgi:hypothetical protein